MPLIGARHPSALVNMAWFWPNWAAFLAGSMLSSKAMASPRRLLFMPTWSMAIPFFHTSWWFNMRLALLEGWHKKSFGFNCCDLASPCWWSKLTIRSTLWLTGLVLSIMAFTSWTTVAGSTGLLPLAMAMAGVMCNDRFVWAVQLLS